MMQYTKIVPENDSFGLIIAASKQEYLWLDLI